MEHYLPFGSELTIYTTYSPPQWLSGKDRLPMQETQETRETRVWSLGEEEMAIYSSILAGRENPMDRGAWQATIHRVAKSQTGLDMHAVHSHIWH